MAEIARSSLAVDDELNSDAIERVMVVDVCTNSLVVDFSADELRQLRVSMGGFFDMLIVVAKTARAFPEIPARLDASSEREEGR